MVPELPPLWSPNCLSNWSFLTHFFASLILLETLVFIVFLYKFSFKMLKFEAKIGQKLRPSKTNLNCWRAVLWTPNCPSKFRHECKLKNKRKPPQKNDNNAKPKRSFLQKEAFSGKKWKKNLIICWPLVC